MAMAWVIRSGRHGERDQWALDNQHLRVRVWEASDVVDAVLRTYDRLPEAVRARLPLRRVWVLADDGL